MNTENRSNKIFYGWVIVAVALLSLIVSNGLSTLGIPVFYKPIREDFVASGAVAADQAESMIALAGSLTFLLAGLFSPIAGYLIDKYSIRLLMIAGCFIMGGSLILHAQATAPATIYISRGLMGISLGLIGVLASTVLVSNWFRRRRGTAIGIILTGTSIGGVLIPLIATPLILSYGWRAAMLAVSLLVWLVLLPAIVVFVRNRPSDIGLLPDGEKIGSQQKSVSDQPEETENRKPNAESGLTFAQALKTPIFWVLALCAALIFYPIFVTTQQFILYLQTPRIGMSAQTASFAQASLFAVSVGGKFFFGFLSDKFSPTRVMLVCCGIMLAATFVLFALTASNAFLFMIPFGLGYGGTFVLLQRIAADYFGLREYGKILGALAVIEMIGATIGGIVTGRLADAAGGDYSQAFYGVTIATGLAFLLIVALGFMHKPHERSA